MNWLREPDTEPLPGYRLIEPIGTGGFGEVWKCVAPGGIHNAIKFVYGNLNALDGDDPRAKTAERSDAVADMRANVENEIFRLDEAGIEPVHRRAPLAIAVVDSERAKDTARGS